MSTHVVVFQYYFLMTNMIEGCLCSQIYFRVQSKYARYTLVVRSIQLGPTRQKREFKPNLELNVDYE